MEIYYLGGYFLSTETNVQSGERSISSYAFKQSLIFPWLKIEMNLTSKRLQIIVTRSLLGFIPTRGEETTIPNKSISSVFTSSGFSLRRIFLGLIFLVIFGYQIDGEFIHQIVAGHILEILPAFILLILSVYLFLTSYTHTFFITNHAGENMGYRIFFTDKEGLHDFADKLNEAISDL